MSHEFNEAEMMPCDLCGEFWPGDEMYELEDGRRSLLRARRQQRPAA